MPRYLVRGFILTSDPQVERVRDYVVNADDDGEAVNLARGVDVNDEVCYFEAEEMKP
jgi:hypothetical protein